MKKLLQMKWLLMPMFFLGAVFSTDAQVAYTQDFEAGLGGWSTGWANQTSLPCSGLSSPRRNIFTVGTQGNFESPLLGTSNGGVVTMSFAYKVTNWSAGTVATPATFGTINVQYAASATGPWTTVHTINSLNHTPDTLCNTVAVPNFTAPPGSMFMRFECIYGAGDYWMYFDDVTISQGAPPACVQPSTLTATSITSTGATLGWTEIGTATAWDVEYGPFGFTQGAGTLTTASSTSLAISGLMSNTQYSFYVRSNCGATGTSVWSGPFSFTTLCASQVSGVVTINAGAPATATNFQSFSAFAAEINVCGIGGPLTVNVVANSGPYVERLVLNEIIGASATNTITINGNGNTLTFEALNTTDRATILLNGTDFLTVNNLKIAGTSLSWAHALHLINGADNNTFSNCEFIVSTVATTSFVSSIALSGSLTSATTAGNTGSNNTFINNLHKGGYYGITLMGPSTTVPNVGNKVLNSTFEDYYFYGVYISNQEDAEIVNNDISRATRTTVSTFYGIGFFGTNPGTLISRNSIHDNLTAAPTSTSAAYPIYASSGAGTLAKPMNIINNQIYNIKGNGITYGAYFLTNTFHINFYHNSIVLDNTSQTGASAIAGVYHTGLATGFDMKNNIIHINNGNTGIKRVLWFSNTAPAFTSNNNVLFNASTTGTNHLVTRGTTNFATLALWQASNGSIYDQNSVSADAVFTNAGVGNLKPLSAAVDNIGAPLGITTDITGAARSAATPDAGAYEFAPVSSDISLTAGALLRGNCYSTNDTVSLTITNIIGATVDLAVNPIVATWSVTGPSASNGTITFNSGTLAAGASMTMKAGGVSMPAGGTYLLNAYISPTTINTVASNDTINASLNVRKLLLSSPALTTITNNTDTLELSAATGSISAGTFIITEICHFKTTVGAPTTGWPSYLIADDYIEITGAPGADLAGFTLEQYSATALVSSFAFPIGTILSPNGTAVIAVGQLGSSVPVPASFYYHGNGAFTGSFGSTESIGRVLKDPSNNIIDAVGYGTYTFPAIANVTAADWSGNTPALSSSGNKLEGLYTKSAANWVNSGVVAQNPNEFNSGLLVPITSNPSFTWSLNGTSLGNNGKIVVGPFSTSGTFQYVAAINTSACGLVYDTATVVVQLPVTSLQGQIGFGTTVPSATLYTPVYRFSNASTTRFNRALTIYTEAEMLAAGISPGSTIQKLAFDKAGAGATNGINELTLNIWMGTSNKTAPLAAQDWAASILGKTQVLADTNVTIPAATGWVEFTFDTPFFYPGGTLEIAFENSMTGAAPFSTDKFDWKYDAAFGTTHNIGSVSAGTTFATGNLTSSTLYSWRPNTLFTYSPASGPELGITALTNPTGGVSCVANQPISIEIGSFGLTNITAATINWEFNGVAQTAASYTGNLASGQVANVALGTVIPIAGVNTVKAWVASATPGSGFAGNDTITESFTVGISGTYTINSAQATGGTNFQTFGAFASALNVGLCGPVVANVVAGSGPYNEQVTIGAIPGTSATNTITINGNNNTLTFLSTNTNERATLKLDGTDYITIKKLSIVAQGSLTTAPAEFGFAFQMMNNADYVTVDSCTIQATDNSTSLNFSAFVASSSPTSATVAGTPGSNLTVTNSNIIGGYFGLTYSGPSTGSQDNIVFENNTVRDFYLYGIYVRGASNSSIADNDINRATRTGTISTFYGIYLNGLLEGTEILRNRIHDNGTPNTSTSHTAYPFFLTGANGSVTNPYLIANNLVYNINNNAGIVYGLYSISVNNVRVYHNTIDISNSTGAGTSAIRSVFITGATSNMEVRNNIFSINHTNTGAKHVLYYSNTATGFVSNNNVVYNGSAAGTNFIGFWGVNQTSLGDMQTASSQDLLSFNTDPLYTAPALGNLTPTSPVADNVGLPVGITTDILGATRSATTPDAGAYEFTTGGLTCPQPTLFSASGITTSSVVLGWTEPGTAPHWTVAYGPIGFNPSIAPTNIAAWNFNGTSTTTIPGGTTAPTPFIGTGAASLVGGTTATFATYAVSGSSSDTTQGVPPNYAWNTSTYAAQGTGDRTRGIQFNVSTVGRTNISFTYDLRLSPTAANTWVIQYSTDVTAATPVWVDAMVYTAPCAECWNRQITANFSGITALENNANAGFRVVAAFVPGTSAYASANVGGSYAATGTARFDMVRVISINAGGGTQLVTNVNPFLLTGLQSNTSYHAYVRSNCGSNDTSLWTGPITFTTAFQCPPNAICETFAAGNGSTEYNTAPTGTSLSACPTSVTIAVPAGSAIASMDVDYSMTAFNGAWLSEQRSRVYSPTVIAGEAAVASGPALNSPGTQAYARTGLTFANGATGNVVVQLHAFRTWGGVAPNCDTIYQYVNNNTFRVIAYLAPAASCTAPTALTSSNITSTSIQVNWNGTAAGYRVQYGPTGFVPGTGTIVTTTADSLVVAGLMSNTAYDFWVMSLCGADSSAYAGPLTATTLCGVFPLTFTETFETSSTSLTCWQVGANWALWPVGGFGNSATSVRFPFYNISSGSFDAFTPTFAPTTAGDQLSFDHAYATYINEVDSVIISYSTDGGATYNLLVGLNGGPTGTMTTAPPTTASFVPTATQWSNFSIPVPAGTNKIRFTAKTAFGNNFYADNVKVGPAAATLQPFALISPPNNATLMVAGSAQTPINVSWQRAGSASGILYQWRAFLPGGSVNAPILSFPSNLAGTDTNLTLSVGAVDAVLASLGVNIGDTATIQWSVRATLGTDSLFATTPFTLSLVRVGVATPQLVAAPQFAVSPGTTGISGPSGTAASAFFRAAQIILPAEYAAANVTSGDGIRTVGFTLNSAATGAVSGVMKVYLVNSTDASYLKSNNWDTIISNMTLIHDDTVTIPVGATQYLMDVNQNFVYTGGSMYLAYDWVQISAPITTGLIYRSNTAVTNSIRRQGSTVAPPVTLTGTSAFRLETLWGIDRPADDLEVIAIFAKGKNALTFGTPEQVQVVVRNNGYLAANKNVTLSSTGANAFTGTVNVNLASAQTTTVTFNYTPTVAGFSTLTASVPADDVSANNAKSYVQEATADRFLYADTSLAGLGAVGFNTATGLLLTRYDVIGSRTVTQVRIRISNNAAAVGNDVYAVVLDSSGAIVGQSGFVTLATADLETWKTFTIPTSPLFNNESFYVGLAQTAGLAGYFPVAFQTETPTRPNAFYSAALAGTGIAPVSNFRLMIEAVLGAPPACPDPTQVAVSPDCIEADVTWTSSANTISSTVQYGPTGFTPGTGTIVTGVTSPFTITGLTVGTTYDVWVKDSCASGPSQYVGPVTFTTDNVPTASFTASVVNVTVNVDATASTGNPTSYAWTFGDGNTGSGVLASNTYSNPGTYTITLTVTNDCGTDVITQTVTVVSIDKYALSSANLYPNPNFGLFQIVGLPMDGGEISIEIMSSTGAIVMRTKVEAGAETKEIDMRGFAPGVYQVRMTNQNGVAVKPFVLRN